MRPWSRRLAAVAVAVLAAGGTISAARPAAAAPAPAPRLSVTPTTVAPGGTVTVAAYSLKALTDWQLQICGNGGYGTSTDCDQTSTAGAATSETGHFVAVLVVGIPPVPCPCVVMAQPERGTGSVSDGTAISVPITIVGAPTAPVNEAPIPAAYSGLKVERAVLSGTGSWAEWFGGSPHRTLVLRIRNTGANLIPNTPFYLRSGRGSDPSQVLAAPVVPVLYPGQSVSYRLPVTFSAVASGRYEVTGVFGATGQEVTFVASTSLFPWGAAAAVLVLVLLLLTWIMLRIIRSRRRRRARRVDEPAALTAVQSVPGAVEPASEPVPIPSASVHPAPRPAVVVLDGPAGVAPVEPPPTAVESPTGH